MAGGAPTFLVVGAGGTIGGEAARRLAARGSVVLAGRGSQRLSDLASELHTEAIELDAASVGQVQSAFEQVVQRHGRLDGVVNCVGSILLKPAHTTSEQQWDQTLATNLTSAFAVVRAAGQTMRRSGGAVVLMSSAAAQHGFANHEAIAAAKAGVIGLTKSAAATYAPFGLRFNAVAPGLVRTGMTEPIWSREASRRASEAMHAVGRLGEPADVASGIEWLLNPANSWITGEVLTIDGGLSTVRTAANHRA